MKNNSLKKKIKKRIDNTSPREIVSKTFSILWIFIGIALIVLLFVYGKHLSIIINNNLDKIKNFFNFWR